MNKLKALFLLGIVLTLLVAVSFMYGAYTACSKGNGILNGLNCTNVKIVGACEDQQGFVYKLPETNTPFNLTR